ncbi:MAG: CotH kinase family protein [Verrucomicrobia bacterium]|nr:CotH kinase family protein [Verrucomicrobiota bacterium]
MPWPFPWRWTLLLAASLPLRSAVIFNEVLYHPPDDLDELQFIELHNTGAQPVSLEGWKLTRGVRFQAPALTLPAGEFGVVCRDPGAFRRQFGTNALVLGQFEGRLKHGGERLELTDGRGQVVDALAFDDRAPWPTGPDGNGASLERIAGGAASNDAHNWAAAVGEDPSEIAATPGAANSVAASGLPPVIDDLRFTPPEPGTPVPVEVRVTPADSGLRVELLYRSLPLDGTPAEERIAMKAIGADGRFAATIPPQPAGRLLRFRVRAEDAAGRVRFEPAPGEPRPTHSAYLHPATNQLTIPEAFLLQFGPQESEGASMRRRRRGNATVLLRGQSAFILAPTNRGPIQTFDHIRITPRSGGWKVRFHKDRPLDGITTLNLMHEPQPRWTLSEPLSYEVFRRSGVPTPLTGHLRVWRQGSPLGYHLFVEQANGSFLRRTGLDPDGSLYKLLWYGRDVIGQHEQKNGAAVGHADLLETLAGLEPQRAEGQWKFIQDHFDVDALASYFAASQCVQNWDGFFNNYFIHRGTGSEGRWIMIPWDQDKTWGDYDGASATYDWYGMPLTYGMRGDKEPAARFSFFRMRSSPWGSTGWWRPGGYFSAPLLANPEFRARFLGRTRELCQTVFTEKAFLPVIEDLERRLAPEVRFRAAVEGGDPEAAVTEFRERIASFRRQLIHRREFLLRALDQSPASK